MKRRTPSFARALLSFIVAVGPLQAQTVFACAMMDTVVHDECCCEEHEPARGCESSNCGAALESREAPCCERSVDIGADPDASPSFKPVEVRFDIDPPLFLIPSFEASFTPEATPATRRVRSAPAVNESCSDTYLVTQRLRI